MGIKHDNSSAARAGRRSASNKTRWRREVVRRRVTLPSGDSGVEVDRAGGISLIEMPNGDMKKLRSTHVVYCDG